MKKRTAIRKMLDFLFFPLRAITLFHQDKWGLSSLASERFYYAAEEVRGYCLDVGCGRFNRFVTEFLNGNGRGIDVFSYEGLSADQVVKDISHFPFGSDQFDTVTFLANINHIPRSMRDIELAESYRCLKPKGKIIITMGNPLTEILVHQVVRFYDRYFRTNVDMDGERGMKAGEEYYLLDGEIIDRLKKAGFANIRKRYFITQWCLNHMFVAEKPQ